MLVAGIILLSIGTFLFLVFAASNLPVYSVVEIIIFFIAPGVILLIFGIKRKKMLNRLSQNKQESYYYVCAKCGYQVFEDYNCCPNCGETISFKKEQEKLICECGKELEENFIACPYCGKKRTLEKPKGKFCAECGNKLDDNFVVCPYCGKKIN